MLPNSISLRYQAEATELLCIHKEFTELDYKLHKLPSYNLLLTSARIMYVKFRIEKDTYFYWINRRGKKVANHNTLPIS